MVYDGAFYSMPVVAYVNVMLELIYCLLYLPPLRYCLIDIRSCTWFE